MKELQTELIDAVIEAAKVVSSTMGPDGHNVALLKNGFPITVRDGVFIAKELTYDDPIKQMGAKLLADAASTTVAEAGDGTTTTCAMVWGMLEAYRNSNSLPLLPRLIDDLKKSKDVAIEKINSLKIDVTPEILSEVATISANNNPELGKDVADMVERIGPYGAVYIEDGMDRKTSISVENGYSFDGRPIGHFDKQMVLDNVYILLAEEKISDQHSLLPIYEEFKKKAFDGKSWNATLICVVSDIQDSALRAAMLNYQQNRVPVLFVKAPESGENRLSAMRDISAITGSYLFSEYLGHRVKGLKSHKVENIFGFVNQVRIDRNKTTLFFSDREKEITDRVNVLKDEMGELEVDSAKYNFIQSSISKLTGGVGMVYVGGDTDTEKAYTGMLLDDSIMACKSAFKSGAIPGLAKSLARSITGNKIIDSGLLKPLNVLGENSGVDPSVLMASENMLTGKPIYDPLQVAVSAIKNSISLVEQIIRTKYVKI